MMLLKKFKLKVLLVVLGLLAAGLAACTDSPSSNERPTPTMAEGHGFRQTASSIKNLVSNSPFIVIATVHGGPENVRVEGQTSDGQPDPRFTSYYDMYSVSVETYLKGNGPATFEFAQLEKTLIHNPNREPSQTFSVVSPLSKLEDGARYMLFLYPFTEGRYAPTYVEPTRWLLRDGTATPLSLSDSAKVVFQGRSESQLRSEVANAVATSTAK